MFQAEKQASVFQLAIPPLRGIYGSRRSAAHACSAVHFGGAGVGMELLQYLPLDGVVFAYYRMAVTGPSHGVCAVTPQPVALLRSIFVGAIS